MTDKEILSQFDAMCKEWYGDNGYSRLVEDLGDWRTIEMVGFAGWSTDDGVNEKGNIQNVRLVLNTCTNKYELNIKLIEYHTRSFKAIVASIHSVVNKYFSVFYMDKESWTDTHECFIVFDLK